MLSFFDKIKILFKQAQPDAEIQGDVKFQTDGTPYFAVKMHGCQHWVDINAEDIVEVFAHKFGHADIRNATKVFMKYRNLVQLVSIEKNFALLHDKKLGTYQLVDLSDSAQLGELDFSTLKADDAFKLGMYFEKIRAVKDRKLFQLTKSSFNISRLKVIHTKE